METQGVYTVKMFNSCHRLDVIHRADR